MNVMKANLMRRILICALSAAMIFLLSCKHDGTLEIMHHNSRLPLISNNDQIIIVDDIDSLTFIADPARIDTASVQSDLLVLKVSHAGGCEPHDFALYGLSALLESNPPQAEIFLSHEAHGDMCEAWLTKELQIDLSPLREVYQQAYGKHGTILLRIHSPGVSEPVMPLLMYSF